MTDRAADWARTLALIRARRVLLGLEDADERARTYLYVRALPDGETRQLAIAYLRAGLALGIPDAPGDVEVACGLQPPRRRADWLPRLIDAAHPRARDARTRQRAWTAIAVLDLIHPPTAARAASRLIRLCARWPVPGPLPVEVELTVDRLHRTPALREARAVLRALIAGQHVPTRARAQAAEAIAASLPQPWRHWARVLIWACGR